jgi:prepilin-type N-terminal cleavage/methylation domain-containing protein
MFILEQAVMVKKAFTLIEVLVAIIIMGILSSLGVIGYNNYTASVKDTATKSNYETINKLSESEFAKCKLNKNSKIFNNHDCKSSAPPTIAQLDDYFTNFQKLKNPYDQKQKVIQNDICVEGGVTLRTTNTGVYETAYFSKKNNTKNTSNINSTWAQKFQETSSASVTFSCTQTVSIPLTPISATPPGSFSSYSVPANCPTKNCLGAYIKVDVNGKMTGDYDGGAVMEKDVAQSWSNSSYKWVLVNPADATGNVSSACAQRACSYNFSNNTYTVNQVVYDPLTGKPK